MIIRSPGDIVLASNMAQDLTNLVVAYLAFYKKYAQGINGVFVPDTHYSVIFRPITKDGILVVTLIHTKTSTWEEPVYYDVDSDYYSESYSRSANISHYTTHSSTDNCESTLNIPFRVLLLSCEEMEKQVKDYAAHKEAERLEKERQAEIAKYKAKIAELEKGKV